MDRYKQDPPEVPREHLLYSSVYSRYLGDGGLWSTSVRDGINSCIQKSPPSLLWHYCSVPGFENICRSGHIYLSGLESMNDYQEGRWLRNQIARRITGDARVFLPYLEASRSRFNLGPFVTSLSEDGDLLSQWRAYATGGSGVALGLRSEELSIPVFQITKEQLPSYTALCNVIYDTDIQELVANAIVDIINGIVRAMQGHSFPPSSHPYIPCSALVNMYLHYIEPL